MNISELIKELEEIKESHGDMLIWMRNTDWNTLCALKLALVGDSYGHLQVVVEPD